MPRKRVGYSTSVVELRHIGSTKTTARIATDHFDDGSSTTYVSLGRFHPENGLVGHFLLFPENLRNLRDALNKLDLDNLGY